jgi:hypothetical protein
MSILTHSRDVDASHASISFATRDQINYNGPTTNHNHNHNHSYSFSLFGPISHASSSHPPRDNQLYHVTGFNSLISNLNDPGAITIYHSADPFPAIREALVLIDNISTALNDPTDSSKDYHELQLILKTLRQILCLTTCAIEAYKDKPLGQNLVNVVTPEVRRCCILLWELRNKIYDTWLLLICTRIGHLWRHVFLGSFRGDELASLKKRLRRSEYSLGIFIMALSSYVLFVSDASPNTKGDIVSYG